MAKGLSIADLIEILKKREVTGKTDYGSRFWRTVPEGYRNLDPGINKWRGEEMIPGPDLDPGISIIPEEVDLEEQGRYLRQTGGFPFGGVKKWHRDGIGIYPERTPEQEAITRETGRRMQEAMPKITFPHKWMGRWYNEQEWEALQKRMREHRQRQNESYRESGRIPSWMSLL